MPVGLGSELVWWSPTLDNAGNGTGLSLDLSGNSRNASVGGWVTEGSDRYVTSLSRANFAIGNNYTWARWVYLTSVAHNRTVCGFNDNSNRVANCICGETNGSVYFQHGTTADQYNYLGDCFIGLNQWRHIACRVVNTSGSNFTSTIFLDGSPVSTINFSGTLKTTTQQYMAGPTAFGTAVTQRIDDWRFYNRALSNAEVASLATRRGYQPTLPTGLGGEVLWICPSLDNTGNGYNTAWDLTGVNDPGILTNMDPATAWLADTSNGGVRSINFNAVTQVIDLPNASILEPQSIGSLSAWVRFASVHAFSQVITKRLNASVNNPIGLDLNVSSLPRTLISNGASLNQTSGSTAVINTWYHLGSTWDGSTLRLYVNGSLANSIAQTLNPQTGTGAMSIGNARNVSGTLPATYGSGPLAGRVDDLRYFHRVLSASEMTILASRRGYQPFGSRRRRYAGSYGL